MTKNWILNDKRTSGHSTKYRPPPPTYERGTFWMVQTKSSFFQVWPDHTYVYFPWWYLHLVKGTVGSVRKFMCTSWFDSYASSSLATGMATHAGQVVCEKCMNEKCSIPWPSRLKVGCGDHILTLVSAQMSQIPAMAKVMNWRAKEDEEEEDEVE